MGSSSAQGFTSAIVWKNIDILVSTPQTLNNHLEIFKKLKEGVLDPEFIVVDEADLLLELDKNVSKNTDKILSFIRKNSTNPTNIKYLLAASSFPKKYKK